MSQAAAVGIASVPLRVGAARACWEDRSLPVLLLLEPSPGCGWVLVPALLQPELILPPLPKKLGVCRALVQLSQLCWGRTRQTQAMESSCLY